MASCCASGMPMPSAICLLAKLSVRRLAETLLFVGRSQLPIANIHYQGTKGGMLHRGSEPRDSGTNLTRFNANAKR